jgi:hypothetical protein
MASVKISELTALTAPAAADELAVVDVSATSTKKTTVGEVVGIINGDVEVANDGTATISELPVSKLQDGAARQLLQTDAAGTGVEWASNIDIPGTLDVTGAATLDSTLTVSLGISSAGNVIIGKISTGDISATGAELGATGYGIFARESNPSLFVNRKTNDGDLVIFYQDSVQEGTISVSGTTVSYNGAHLSRWSQLPGGAERTEILRGTVLSNIDEMCGWDEEDNEQLNRMKVSDVEGDPNVSGVFQGWDDDDDTYTDDFYCAMTGDFIIRLAEGVTVQRGDLLMSAGDGTAKPQDDDIIRSKTIAKVTSTHITCTYDDGSYCVPCVLMAC